MRLIVLLAVLVIAACATAGPRALAETSWTLVEIQGQALPALETPLTLRFEAADFRVAGYGGCNQFGGRYTVDGEGLSFGQLISTKRACLDEAANEREAQFLGLLGAVSRYTRSGDDLRLFAGDREVLRFRRTAP